MNVLCMSTWSMRINLERKKEQHFWKTKLQLKKKKERSSKGRKSRLLVIATQWNRSPRHKNTRCSFPWPQGHFTLSWCSHLFLASNIFIIIVIFSDIFQVFISDQKWNYFGKCEGKRKTGRIKLPDSYGILKRYLLFLNVFHSMTQTLFLNRNFNLQQI